MVDLTAAGLAANTLTLARMGTPGLIAATEVVNGGKFRVSKPVKLKAPIDGVQKLICIGMNYVEHCTEQNMPIPTEPVVFNKFPNVICGPGDPLIKDPETNVRASALLVYGGPVSTGGGGLTDCAIPRCRNWTTRSSSRL